MPKQISFNKFEKEVIDLEISKLIKKGVVQESQHEPGEFINTIFVRPKKDGNWRLILNLRRLNVHVVYRKFKMDTLKTVLNLIFPNAFMASVDLRDAYFTVPIHSSHQKYLKFYWQDKLYKFKACPNGYSAAPRVFTKLLKPFFLPG